MRCHSPVSRQCRSPGYHDEEGLDTHTHTHTHTQDNYCNPLCACTPRVNNNAVAAADNGNNNNNCNNDDEDEDDIIMY